MKHRRHYFHLKYHPHDIFRRSIKEIYTVTCNKANAGEEEFGRFRDIGNMNRNCLRIEKLTLAYSHPKT